MRDSCSEGATSRRIGRRLLLPAALTVAVAVVAFQVWAFRGRQGTVAAGRLYRSAALPPDRLAQICADQGIRTVIDFRNTESDARAESTALAARGIRHVHLPSTQVPSDETVARFLEVLRSHEGEPVLMHCRHGVGRVGVFTAIYRIEIQGWRPSSALLEAMVYSGFGSFLPGSPKAQFILSYRPRRKVRAEPEPRR